MYIPEELTMPGSMAYQVRSSVSKPQNPPGGEPKMFTE